MSGFSSPLPLPFISATPPGPNQATFVSLPHPLGLHGTPAGPAGAGFRSMLAFWMGGASGQTGTPPQPPVGYVPRIRARRVRKDQYRVEFDGQALEGTAQEVARAINAMARAEGQSEKLQARAILPATDSLLDFIGESDDDLAAMIIVLLEGLD